MTACHRMLLIVLGLVLPPAQADAGGAAAEGPAAAPVPSAEMLDFLAEWPEFDAETFDAMVRYGRRDARSGPADAAMEGREGQRDEDE